MDSYLNVAIVKCPRCGKFYAESSWYVLDMESDMRCGKCGKEFNSKETLTDKILAKFEMDEEGKVKKISFEKPKV